jgi:CcmD family protein
MSGGSGMTYLFAAYTLIWVVIFAYQFYLGRKQKSLEKRVEALRRAVASKKNASGV